MWAPGYHVVDPQGLHICQRSPGYVCGIPTTTVSVCLSVCVPVHSLFETLPGQ